MANAPVDVYEPGMLCRVRERRQALQGGGKCCQNWHRKEGYEGKPRLQEKPKEKKGGRLRRKGGGKRGEEQQEKKGLLGKRLTAKI